MTAPHAEYGGRRQQWGERIAALDRSHLFFSNFRLAVAAAVAIALWLAFVGNAISPWWPVALGLVFLGLVVAHAKLLQRVDRARRAHDWYLRALDRLDGRWAGRGRDGAHYLDGHTYARDLDLFGSGSLFELINTAQTEAGENALAGWLRAGAENDEVLARQASVDELRGKIDFREDIAVLGAESGASKTSALAAWAAAGPVGLNAAIATALVACALVTVAITAFVFAGYAGAQWLVFWLFVEYLLTAAWQRRFGQALVGIANADHDLLLVSALLARIEREPLTAPRLRAILSTLTTDGMPPSRRIARLRTLVSWLDSTRNQLFAPIAFSLLLPQLLAVAIDRWRGAYGPHVADWLTAVGDLEALAALATYAFEHPADPFPSLLGGERGAVFEAIALGHPLMPEQTAIRNDVAIGGDAPHVIVISGSNMSGKSTLLRSVGVNVVLARAGAPVRAERLALSPLVPGATLRVEDSLQAGQSRFYAEILRIRDVVNAARDARQPWAVLFLLDEILHGTNSHDRRIGAQAVVRALVEIGAIGLVTTHDLALTELPSQLGPRAENRHFEDRLEDGRMIFDYRMRPGIVEHSNALALMRAVGLDV